MHRSRRCRDRRGCEPAPRLIPDRIHDDTGSATLEFATAGLLLLLPLTALVVLLGTIQAGAFAVQAAATQSARVIAAGAATTSPAASNAIAFALADHGFTIGAATVAISCVPVSPCPSRGGIVTVAIDLAVALPMVPGILGAAPPSVTVSATATRPVSRFAGLP